MSRVSLSWTIGNGGSCRGGNQANVEWPEIETLLEQIRSQSGSLTLYDIDPPMPGPQIFQVFSDQGYFLLMLGEDDGRDYRVRSFSNMDARSGQIELLGDLWDSRMVCSDLDIVKQVVKEYLETGDVAHSRLN
jgi:hypothetical protein